MDSVIEDLLASAGQAGLTISVDEGRLTVQGPKRAETLAVMILRSKKAVVEHLAKAGEHQKPQPGDIDPERVRMPFGKHRGTPVSELDPSHVGWLWHKCDRLAQFPEAEIAVAALVHEPKDKKPRDGEMAPATGYESDIRYSKESM